MRKRSNGLTRPQGEHNVATTYDLTPAGVRVTRSVTWGDTPGPTWTTEVTRAEGRDRIGIASQCAMVLHLSPLEQALAVADRVLQMLGEGAPRADAEG